MIWVYFLLIIGFFGYHFILYSYASYIFNRNQRKILYGTICGVINIVFWILCCRYLSVVYEAVVVLGYVLLLIVEFKVVFKVKNMFAVFLAMAFAINLFAKIFIGMASVALVKGGGIVETVDNAQMRMLIVAISFTFSIGTIFTARSSLKRIYLDTILSDELNMKFLTGIYSLLYATMFVFALTISTTQGGAGFVFHFLLTGVFALIGFVGFLIYAYSLADLRIAYVDYEKIRDQNEEQLNLIKKLEEESLTDDLTKMHMRIVFDETLAKKTSNKEKFFIVFIDIDGLKYVNDTYGHVEGDFYIQKISQVINNTFYGYVVCRYGGDEILVIGNYDSEASINSKVVSCHHEVVNLKQRYDKEYYTSISYGVVFADEANTLEAEQLIALADKRMYEFKRLGKKQRKTNRI